jgi:anti-sigma factor RsiW
LGEEQGIDLVIMDDALLSAYVDGELSPQERQQVEKDIAVSFYLAERAACFTASRLPYREAFAHQKLPRVPIELTFDRAHPVGHEGPLWPTSGRSPSARERRKWVDGLNRSRGRGSGGRRRPVRGP